MNVGPEYFDKSVCEEIRCRTTRDDFNQVTCDRCNNLKPLNTDKMLSLCDDCLDIIFE